MQETEDKKRKIYKIAALVSGLSGFVIILGILIPIIRYEIMARQKYPVLISPVKTTLGGVLEWGFKDTTDPNNWFVNKSFKYSDIKKEYLLSIPKLKIDKATVVIGGEDLKKSLIHYPGTALPGKIGNAVIFGHSVLPIFYNPKDYKTIFSKLPNLKEGDLIEISFDGVYFKFTVENMFEVYPDDIEVLEQETSDSFLTLVTCVPPGDPRMPRRLVIRARVIPF